MYLWSRQLPSARFQRVLHGYSDCFTAVHSPLQQGSSLRSVLNALQRDDEKPQDRGCWWLPAAATGGAASGGLDLRSCPSYIIHHRSLMELVSRAEFLQVTVIVSHGKSGRQVVGWLVRGERGWYAGGPHQEYIS